MWIRSVLAKEPRDASGKAAEGSAFPVPAEASPEILELRRKAAELQAAVARANRAEDVLRESEERFRRLFEDAPLGMAAADPYSHFTRANAAFCRMTGYGEKELAALSFKDITHPDDIAAETEAANALLRGDLPVYKGEKRCVRKDREILWVEATVSAVRNGNGQFQHFLVMLEDITVRKQAAGDLLQSRQEYRELANGLPSGIFETDPDGRLTFVNRMALEWSGYTEEEALTGMIFLDFVIESDRKRAAERFHRIMTSGQASSAEYTAIKKDGGMFPVLVTTRAIIKDGRPVRLLGILSDISERKLEEKELRENEEKYRMLFETVNDAIYLMEADRIIDCNANMLETFGFRAKDEIVGISPWALSPAAQPDGRVSRDKIGEFIAAALDGQPQRFFWTYHRKDETPFDAEVSLTSLVLGGRARFLAVVRDITERKQARHLQDAVYRISQAADKSATLDDLFKSVHDIVGTVMPASNFYIAQYDAGEEMLSFPYFVDEEDPPPTPHKANKGLTEYVIRTGRPLLCDEAKDRELRGRGDVDLIGAPSAIWLGVPLIVEDKTIGAMVVQHYSDPHAYGQREFRMLEYVSSQVAKSIERKRGEKALHDSEELHRKLVAAVPDMIVRTDLDGTILFANDLAVRLAATRAAKDLVGQNILSFVASEDKERAVQTMRLMFEKRLTPQEYSMILKGGDKIQFEVNAAVLRDTDRTPYGFVFLCRDIMERKQAEKDLRGSLSQLRTTLKAAIDSLASAIEMRDPYTAGHQERVTRLACAIAREMGLPEDRIEGIQIAGVIHDIGKLYVPAEILSKPTKLSDLEYSMIKVHSEVGYTILSKIDFPWPIAKIVYQHHETINGSGYPQGLTGKDILLEAKILCVADVVEAMSSHRPYRPALGIKPALEEVSQKRGILYDREVVDACLKLFVEKNFKFD